jgi:hypothetical protein
MVISRHQNTGQNYDLPAANKFFENMAEVEIFGNSIKK